MIDESLYSQRARLQTANTCVRDDGGDGDDTVKFRTGAFVGGAPVIPAIVRYPYSTFNPAWSAVPFSRHILRLSVQFFNSVEVTYLPPVFPTEEQSKDPERYASDVRKHMAKEMGVTMSDSTYKDVQDFVKLKGYGYM